MLVSWNYSWLMLTMDRGCVEYLGTYLYVGVALGGHNSLCGFSLAWLWRCISLPLQPHLTSFDFT